MQQMSYCFVQGKLFFAYTQIVYTTNDVLCFFFIGTACTFTLAYTTVQLSVFILL